MAGARVLVVRLGAMEDVIQTLPAVASLKHGIPHSKITWIVEKRWSALFEGNPYVDRTIFLDRGSLGGILGAWRDLRSSHYEFAVDFQGLIKSAAIAAIARPERIFGFASPLVREWPAAWCYSNKTRSTSVHMVDLNLDLAAAAGASSLLRTFPLPPGRPEGRLPSGDFVLASPLAGWGAKQWPLEFYADLGKRLRREFGLKLVLNAAESVEVDGADPHISGLPGLLDATRRATAVVGVDSGPLHLAAALGKTGIAMYGPTDPARNGPYGGTFTVLRSPDAVTTLKRTTDPHPSMRAISPATVFEALAKVLCSRSVTPTL